MTNGSHHHDRRKSGRSHASSRQCAVIRRWAIRDTRRRIAGCGMKKRLFARVQRAMLTTVMSLDAASVLLFLMTVALFFALIIEWMGL